MSFQDIETGCLALPRGQASSTLSQSPEDTAFAGLQNSLSLQVFKINSNVQAMLKLVDQLGTSEDSAGLRKNLHDMTDVTRAMAKRSSEVLKKLAGLQANLPHQKTALQKTSHDLQNSLLAFQRAQQLSAERQRTVVESVKIAAEEESSLNEGSSVTQRPAQVFQQRPSPPHGLAHQEHLIREREQDIREVETGIHELAEIFHDLRTFVIGQGDMLDNIERNISSVAGDTSGAAEGLATAHDYQKKAGQGKSCLMIILAVVVAAVLVAARMVENDRPQYL